MRTTSERYIDATDEATVKLAKAFGVTKKFVYMALTYRVDTEKARRVRHTAVKEYGAVPMRHCPECETLFLMTENGRQIMRQTFDNGVELSVDRETGDAVMRDRRGDIVSSWEKLSFAKLAEVQLYAESL